MNLDQDVADLGILSQVMTSISNVCRMCAAGDQSTSTHDLDRAGHELLGSFYRGAFRADSEPKPDGTDHM